MSFILLPHGQTVNGLLNSEPLEERRGESLVTSALVKQTVLGHSQARQHDCPCGIVSTALCHFCVGKILLLVWELAQVRDSASRA